VDGDLRVISTRLDAQVAVGFLRVQLVCGKVGQPLQRSGLPIGQAEPTQTTAAASLESGSDNALTASESCLTSVSLSLS
jgi:hypothetical protein